MDTEAALVAAWRRAEAAQLTLHRLTDHQISHSVYLFDPEGNLHEFYADALRDWRTIFNPTREDLVSGDWNPTAAAPIQQPYWDPKPEVRRVPDAVFHPVRITHASLAVRDLAACAGSSPRSAASSRWRTARPRASSSCAAPPRPGPDLVLIDAGGRCRPRTAPHRLRGGERGGAPGLRRAAREQGVEIELILDRPSKRSIFVRDPDRMLTEFYARRGTAREDLTRATPALRPYLA